MRATNLLIFIFLSLFSGCSSGGGTSGTGGFGYKGEIISQSGVPDEGAHVSLESAAGQALATTTTSKEGQFDFGKIDFADAVIIVSLDNGRRTHLMVSIPEGKNVARVTFRENGEELENTVRFEKDQTSQASSSSSQSSVTVPSSLSSAQPSPEPSSISEGASSFESSSGGQSRPNNPSSASPNPNANSGQDQGNGSGNGNGNNSGNGNGPGKGSNGNGAGNGKREGKVGK